MGSDNRPAVEAWLARVKPELLWPVVSAFEDGSVEHTGEDVPSAEYQKLVDQFEGLKTLLTNLGVGESPAACASGIEFVLEGLHLTKRLNKDALGGRATYRARG